jgi:prepilin-type N-terminal cleavage/methylation domain-containing protein
MLTDSPRTRQPNGFTLVEMLAVLLLVVILASQFLSAPRPSGARAAGDAAAQIRAMLTAALANADLEGSDVVIRADPDSTASRSGRFIAWEGPPGVAVPTDTLAGWVDLQEGVAWRAGTAALDPMGVPTDGKVPGTVRCTAAECETGAADYVVYYVGHVRATAASWALVLTRSRTVVLYRWDPARSAWEAAR